jgi:thiamine pyrophosphate-dependent acetolactate synthase large subunit-like protein
MTSPTTPRTILGTDYILEALAAEGLGHLFMVPGGLVDPFLPVLARQKKLTPVVAAHEGGAVYMADGYARASGSFGAALGIGGPGCCNMATAVAAAKTDGSPVLAMTGEVPLDLEDRGTFQDASQATLDDTAVMAPLTRLSKTAASAKNLNHWFRHALTAMWAQPRGPVHLSLTHDALAGECAADYVAVSGFFAHAWRLSMEAAETALRLLADKAGSKSRIAILAGAGVEHDAAAARLKEIAERWSIPVATTLRAKGVFREEGVRAPRHHVTQVAVGGELLHVGAYAPRTYISATNLGPMGWAIPAAIGVQCARPDRRVAVITGDGCMQMHGIEVLTAARYRLPIVYVVINNSALGNVWLRARQYGALPAELTSIPDHDWAGFARALGAQGFTVRDPAELESTFQQALAADATALIDVKADKNCVTPVYDFSAGARAWSYHE